MKNLGRRVLALAFAVFGVIYLLHAVFSHTLFPGPPLQASANPTINVVGGLLFLGAAAVVGLPKQPHPSSMGVAALLVVYTACLHWTAIIAKPTNALAWTSTCEVLGLASGCFAASGSGVRCGRLVYGLSLVGLAVLHVLFHAFVATMVPSWYPLNSIWPYVTAVGFFAGGIAYLAGVQIRLASVLLAVMFLVFAVTLHVPDVVTHLASGGRWTGLFVALGFASGALMFAGSGSSKSA